MACLVLLKVFYSYSTLTFFVYIPGADIYLARAKLNADEQMCW